MSNPRVSRALEHQIANDDIILSIRSVPHTTGQRLECGHYISELTADGTCHKCQVQEIAKERERHRRRLPFYLR